MRWLRFRHRFPVVKKLRSRKNPAFVVAALPLASRRVSPGEACSEEQAPSCPTEGTLLQELFVTGCLMAHVLQFHPTRTTALSLSPPQCPQGDRARQRGGVQDLLRGGGLVRDAADPVCGRLRGGRYRQLLGDESLLAARKLQVRRGVGGDGGGVFAWRLGRFDTSC